MTCELQKDLGNSLKIVIYIYRLYIYSTYVYVYTCINIYLVEAIKVLFISIAWIIKGTDR